MLNVLLDLFVVLLWMMDDAWIQEIEAGERRRPPHGQGSGGALLRGGVRPGRKRRLGTRGA